MSLLLEQLTHRDGRYLEVSRLSLEVDDGELFVLLGPSRSGISTVLRIIAGLTAPDSGRVVLHGRDLSQLPSQRRGVGYVAQHAGLFGQMSVAENVEFGLHVRKVTATERRRMCDTLLDLVGIADLGQRMPHQLLPGQRLRVALARALAYQPALLLLDRPFDTLDKHIRAELRNILRCVQRALGTITIVATHDQAEACVLADRLGVMNAGRLLEVGAPDQLYRHPRTEFVATFLGPANLLVGHRMHDSVQLGSLNVRLPRTMRDVGAPQRIPILARPEDVVLAASEQSLAQPALGRGKVEAVSFCGPFERLRIRLPPLIGVRRIAPPTPFGADYLLVEATRSAEQARRLPLRCGDHVWVGIGHAHAILDSGLRFLMLAGPAPAAQAALAFGRQLARLAHAQTTILADALDGDRLRCHVQEKDSRFGPDLATFEVRDASLPAVEAMLREVEAQQYDLVLLAAPARNRAALVESLLQIGEHHVLVVPSSQPTPARALICVAAGEPSKQDVLVAGRLLYHLGAEATLLGVLPADADSDATHDQVARFLAAGVRTLATLGVPARTVIRSGAIPGAILAEMTVGQFDLLVLGAPLPARDGRSMLAGVFGELLRAAANQAILLVRSPEAVAHASSL